MGCAMRDAARAIVEASLREQHPQGPVEMIRKGVFLRFYAHEFDGETSAKILASIEQAARLMSSRPSPERVSANCNTSLIIPTSSQ